ncbi:PD-(D/E)XK nuclease family protein [Bacteroidales bacterium OttesenSCG-928-A17]|nr:PD-(D/E)XK nuclease family protein [Bacteroidales bacterium OttesenSCG-928-A17]
MNIFKTLASGSGSINEPNVSAFLGYLLNPKEDHGLGDAFLRRFLNPLLAEDNNDNLDFLRGRNLSIHSNFEFEVLLEQAFKNNNKGKQIVDIVILCYEKESQRGHFLAKNIIEQKKAGAGNPKHIFLIENKINDESCKPKKKQLEKQYKQTIEKLKEWKVDAPEDLISVIFVTPDGENCKKEFEGFRETKNTIHLFWSKNKANTNDISSANNNTISVNETVYTMIKDVVEKESKPIDTYCKYTLQAFLEFIENDFRSTITEELEEKKKRENPRFEYKGEKGETGKGYSRPKLAEKIIIDYISNYKKEYGEEISFEKLSDMFPGKMGKAYPPFIKAEEAKDKGRFQVKTNRDNGEYFNYYNNPIEIAGMKICIIRGCDDDEFQEMLKAFNINPDDVKRIK